MRNLQNDLEWLEAGQNRYDLSDEWLKENDCPRYRDEFDNLVAEFAYGITFVESWIAREWLERAIKAEAELTKNTIK